MKSRKLYEAIGYIDDWYLDIVDAPVKEKMHMKKEKHFSVRKTVTYILAAAICISILTVTAMAAGWIPDIFAAVQPESKEDAELLEAAIRVTQAQEPESVSIPEIDFTQFTLFERYYDGESVLLGYDVSKVMPENVVGYQPDAELLEKITHMPDFAQVPIPGQTEDTLDQWMELGALTQEEADEILSNRTTYGKQYDLKKYYQILMDLELKNILTPEQYEEFWKILSETGSCCVATPTEPWVGDHMYINGTDCGDVLGPDCWSYRSDYTTEVGNCIVLNPIPEVTRNLDLVEVEISLKSGWKYWYMELDGDAYTYYVQNPPYQATFTIEKSNN